MITFGQAYHRIKGLRLADIRNLTVRRIRGEDVMPVGSGYWAEPSEDLIIQLLRNPKLPEKITEAVLEGCRVVYAELLAWFAGADGGRQNLLWQEALVRLCRVVDVASPMDLSRLADALLTEIKGKPGITTELLAAAVRACMGFDQTKGRIPLWEEILEIPEVAAYAFNVLVQIQPDRQRIQNYLVDLYRKQVLQNWSVDTAFLLRRAARTSAAPDFIQKVLDALQNDNCWIRVEKNLKLRSWSGAWLSPEAQLSNEAWKRLVSASAMTCPSPPVTANTAKPTSEPLAYLSFGFDRGGVLRPSLNEIP